MNPASPAPSSSPESPYRVAAPLSDAARSPAYVPLDPAHGWMALAFVITSLLRASHPLLGRETFGAEPTLALLAALLIGRRLVNDAWFRLTGRGSIDHGEDVTEQATQGALQRCTTRERSAEGMRAR